MADEVGPALSEADNELGYQSRCSDRPLACGFLKGSGRKCPIRSRIYDRNRSSGCQDINRRIYGLREASICDSLGFTNTSNYSAQNVF